MCQIPIGWPSISLSEHLLDPDSRKSPRFKPMSKEPGIRSYPAQRTRWKGQLTGINLIRLTTQAIRPRTTRPMCVFSGWELQTNRYDLLYSRSMDHVPYVFRIYIEPDPREGSCLGPWTVDRGPCSTPGLDRNRVRISFHRLDGKKIKENKFFVIFCDVR